MRQHDSLLRRDLAAQPTNQPTNQPRSNNENIASDFDHTRSNHKRDGP
jgi:hypothetical protein